MYIRKMFCISPQPTYGNELFEQGAEEHTESQFWAKEPKYKTMVPLNLLRRMSKSVRMGVGTGLPLINEFEDIEGIIIGSANGSIKKSIRFLNQIVEYNEGTLTPTDFVQSTSNSIAGTLALMGKITGYNNTHVNNGIAFEAALLDAILLFEAGKAKRLLIGGVEEISQANYNIDKLRGMFKEEAVRSTELLASKTKGTVSGEGAALFVVDAQVSSSSIAEIIDVDQICYPTKEEIVDKIHHFLEKNQLEASAIDSLFLGYNGDIRTDFYYNWVSEKLFGKEVSIYAYKNLVGDYYTVSSFAMWMAAHLIDGQTLPKETIVRQGQRPVKNVLIYNHYEGTQHGLILLRSC